MQVLVTLDVFWAERVNLQEKYDDPYFEELSRAGHGASAVATEAMGRWARIYHAEGAFAEMDHDSRRRGLLVFSAISDGTQS